MEWNYDISPIRLRRLELEKFVASNEGKTFEQILKKATEKVSRKAWGSALRRPPESP